MSVRSDPDSPTQAEVLARAERLLAASFRVSNVANFEPMTINQVHKLGGAKNADSKTPTQNKPQEPASEPKAPPTEPTVPKKSGAGGKSVHGDIRDSGRLHYEDNRSLRSEVKAKANPVARDHFSEIPDAVDVGTNVFITYFLHAAEIERLIVINKEQLEEAIEMENEIEQMESAYLKVNEALVKANTELSKQREEFESTKKIHVQHLEQAKMHAQEELLKARAAVDMMKTSHEEAMHMKEEHFRNKLEEEMLKHMKNSGQHGQDQEVKMKQILEEAKEQFNKEKENLKKMAEDKLQRELQSLKHSMLLQISAEVEKARKEEEEFFYSQKNILLQELRDNHEHEKKAIEARLRVDKEKEIAVLKEQITQLEDQLLQKEKELQERKRAPALPAIETDRGSVDMCIGSELASPREYSRKKNELRSFMSPNGSVYNQTTSQKILKAQKYQPIMSSSKQRERDRSLLMEAKSAGHTEPDKDNICLDLEKVRNTMNRPPYAEPLITKNSGRRTDVQSANLQPRQLSNRHSEPAFIDSMHQRDSYFKDNEQDRPQLDSSRDRGMGLQAPITTEHYFPGSYTNFSSMQPSRLFTPSEAGQTLDYHMNQASSHNLTGSRPDFFKPIDRSYYMPRNGGNTVVRDSGSNYATIVHTQDRYGDSGWTHNPVMSSAGKYSQNLNGDSTIKGHWVNYKPIISPSATNLELNKPRNSYGLGTKLLPSTSMGNIQQTFIQRNTPISRQTPLAPGTISNYAASRIIRSSQYKNR